LQRHRLRPYRAALRCTQCQGQSDVQRVVDLVDVQRVVDLVDGQRRIRLLPNIRFHPLSTREVAVADAHLMPWCYFWHIPRAIHLNVHHVCIPHTTCASPHHPDPHWFASSSRVQRAGTARVGIKVAAKGVACSHVATTTCTQHRHGARAIRPARLLPCKQGDEADVGERTVCYAAHLA
jgi:hypothetical protein